jgi:hypothetical protein
MIKTCTKCGIPKDIEQFHTNPEGKDGRAARCKSCIREAKQERRKLRKAARVYVPSTSLAPGRDILNLPAQDFIPLHLPPLQNLADVEFTNIDDLELKNLDGYEEIAETLMRRMAVQLG